MHLLDDLHRGGEGELFMFAVAGRVEQAHEGKLLGVLDRL
jgi:hypothetical protein